MFRLLSIALILLLSANALGQETGTIQNGSGGNTEDEGTPNNTRYVLIDSSSSDAVLQDDPDFFKQEPLGRLLTNQRVTLTGEEDGEYVKIKATVDGKEMEGWIKKIVLGEKPFQNERRVTESGAVPSSAYSGNASMGRSTVDPEGLHPQNDPWNGIDLTGAEAKIIPAGIPIWIPIAGGAALIGAGALILLPEDEPDTPTPTTPPIPPANECNATFSITTTPDICNLSNGSATLIQPDTLTPNITWSNGETTTTTSGLPSGIIDVSLTYFGTADSLCTDTLSANIPATTHSFGLTAVPVPPDCTTPGDLAITYTPFSGTSATLSIEGPGGTTQLPDPPSSFLLTEFIPSISGEYTFTIAFDQSTACSETTTSGYKSIPLPTFQVTDIFHPSGPGIPDGAILINIEIAIFPWTLFLNELPFQTGAEPFAAIEGLTEGTYTLAISDGRGCLTPPQTIDLTAGGRPPHPPGPRRFNPTFQFRILPNSPSPHRF